MRKNVFGRRFKRDANERKALFKNLLTSLVMEEGIQTSVAKAKAIKGAADKLITKAKKGGREAYRALEAEVNHNAVVKLIDDLGPRNASRNGGYTRITKLGHRIADNSPEAMIEWVEKPSENLKVKSEKLTEKKEKEAKKEVKKEATVKIAKVKEEKKPAKKVTPKKEGKK